MTQDLFVVAAERIAYESGRNVAQVRMELQNPDDGGLPADGLFSDAFSVGANPAGSDHAPASTPDAS